ncbi:hypothetical protein PCASD_01172 [Puccinia coronata f. sp. avenae]|uniref:Uncharacterized protein n=1 Tax=Puccinia coronata f. sp. avenae TaxID=200324 RepID=A0A2N5TER3_9BASI|nr:hypothetical protein PCASD_11019 [Puccinia coronata f. sp. avenae]PLW50831.1 hypothetical protein PCASD_01172 [Puccinia coronata f. sp. avenae]
MSEIEWGTSQEMAGGMPNVYRHSAVTYDPMYHSKLLYEDPLQTLASDGRKGTTLRSRQCRTFIDVPPSASARDRCQSTVASFRPYFSSSGRLLLQSVAIKMSPAEASNELQKIGERNVDRMSEHSKSFDSDSLSG